MGIKKLKRNIFIEPLSTFEIRKMVIRTTFSHTLFFIRTSYFWLRLSCSYFWTRFWQFSVKSCVLERSCWNFTLKFHVHFYLWCFTLLVSKNGQFSVFYRFFACFLWGEGSKKCFEKKILEKYSKNISYHKKSCFRYQNYVLAIL